MRDYDYNAGRARGPQHPSSEYRKPSDKNLREMLAAAELIGKYNSGETLEENATNLIVRLSRKEKMKASVTKEPVAGKSYLAGQRAVFANRGFKASAARLQHTGTSPTQAA